ncbi:hypothetical protein JCM17042A_14360 [Ruminococcus champanellensis 18P13 = JCM 17042]
MKKNDSDEFSQKKSPDLYMHIQETGKKGVSVSGVYRRKGGDFYDGTDKTDAQTVLQSVCNAGECFRGSPPGRL